MSLLVKPTRAKVAVYYSTNRKAEMKMHGEKNCSALFTLIKDILARHNVDIEKVETPTGSDRQVDFIVEVKAPTPKALEELKEEILQVTSGVSKITFFPLA